MGGQNWNSYKQLTFFSSEFESAAFTGKWCGPSWHLLSFIMTTDATKYCKGLHGLNQLKLKLILKLIQMTTVLALGDILEQKNESTYLTYLEYCHPINREISL